jgi:hypothetical protein
MVNANCKETLAAAAKKIYLFPQVILLRHKEDVPQNSSLDQWHSKLYLIF